MSQQWIPFPTAPTSDRERRSRARAEAQELARAAESRTATIEAEIAEARTGGGRKGRTGGRGRALPFFFFSLGGGEGRGGEDRVLFLFSQVFLLFVFLISFIYFCLGGILEMFGLRGWSLEEFVMFEDTGVRSGGFLRDPFAWRSERSHVLQSSRVPSPP